ncbi:MAG: S8 family serine peptidase [Oscillospiraceae bacterium]|nr:S8 family serine peptidase [Oscillospiraceae bacterium]
MAATASEDDFGEIRLTLGESEMEVDGEKQEISEDGYAVPFVDEDGVLQIPEEAVAGAEAPDESGLLTEEALEAQGDEVQIDHESGTVSITEPYGLCRLIVKTEDGKVQDTYGATQTLSIWDNRTVLQYATKADTEKAAALLEQDASILAWMVDVIVSVDTTVQATETNAAVQAARSKCWGTQRVGADTFMQSLDTENAEEVVVAILDTGVDKDHPFLQGRVLDTGWDFVNDDAYPDDDHSHGTHCAGIVRDATPDNVKILPIKILDQYGDGPLSIVEAAIHYAVDHGADVVSMSLGGSSEKISITDGVEYAYTHNVSCVAAAGNDGCNLDITPTYPANVPLAITVASTGETDLISYFSNYGTNIDIAAPGENVLSSIPGGGFFKYSGTSMATPLVAACVALLKTEDSTRKPAEIEEILYSKAKDRGAPGRDDHYGAGVVWLGDYMPLERISFPTDSYTMYEHDLKKFVLRYVPDYPSDNTVTYQSSDPSVVEVRDADGYLKALQPGTAAITATTTQGALQTTVRITVLPQPFTQVIPCSDSGLVFLKSDGTASCFGTSLSGELGYYYGSGNHTFFPFNKDADTAETNIAQFYQTSSIATSYYVKTDGTIWRCGDSPTAEFCDFRFPHPLKTEDGDVLTDICAVNFDGCLLRRDGTVWLPTDENSLVYRILLKENGAPLTNVVSIEGSFFARCADGTLWTWLQPTALESWDCMYARALCDGNGETLTDVQQAYVFGTDLHDSGYTDDSQWDYSFSSEYVTFLQSDGSVWAFGTNKNGQLATSALKDCKSPVPICTAQDVPLTDVVKLIDRAALRADGTLWVWGGAVAGKYNGWMGIGPYDAETKLYAQQTMIDAKTPLTDVVDFWFNGILVAQCADNSLWWSDEESGYMVPMVLDGERMYLQPDAAAPSKREVKSVSLDVSQRSLQVGKSFTLHACVLPADADKPDVTWSSADTTIAYVDGSGTVYARSAGTVVISAISMENKKISARCTVRVENSTLQKVKLYTPPTRQQYHLGEPLDTTGGVLQLIFTDGHLRYVPFSAFDCTGFDASKLGEQTVRVAYGSFTVSFPVTVSVSDPAITELSMQTLPDKTVYFPGETFSADGAAICAQYADGTSRILPLTEAMYMQPDLEEAGTYVIEVSCGGASCSFAVSVVQPEVVRIAPDGNLPQALQGENVDLTDIQIRVYYADGTSEIMDVTENMCTYSTDTLGTQELTVTYAGCETKFYFSVTTPEKEIAAISMHSLPYVLYYKNIALVAFGYTDKTGYPVCTDGGSILVEYVDGSTQVLPLRDYMCSRIQKPTSVNPTKTVTVHYGGCTTSFDVFRTDIDSTNLVSLQITQVPYKTEYLVGERFVAISSRRAKSGRVLLTWKDGTQKEISMADQGISVELENPNDYETPGEKNVLVYILSNKQKIGDSFVIQYLDRYEAGVIYESYFGSKPYKTAYALGETLDTTGGRIEITRSTDYGVYQYASQSIDVTPDMCSGYDMSVPGTQTVTVDTGVVQLDYTITVFTITAQCLQPEIEIGQVSCIQTEFTPYVAEKREILWTSSDPDIATVDAYGRVTGIAPGTVEITAQVKGSEAVASCTVRVKERQSVYMPGDADGDGEVDLVDVAMIRRYLAGGWNAVIDLQNADVNGDGSVDLRDCVTLERYLAGGWNISL